MTASNLIGSWRFVKTRVFAWRYEPIETGVRLTTRKGAYYRDLPLRVEGEFLVLTGTHGWSSWLEPILASERPSFLTLFFKRPVAN
jgi:hypothetical protein